MQNNFWQLYSFPLVIPTLGNKIFQNNQFLQRTSKKHDTEMKIEVKRKPNSTHILY